MNPLTGAMQIEIPSFRGHAIADVNGSFARTRCSCATFEALATPSNGRILRQCSRWTTRPSLLAATTARPRHTAQFRHLWITVEMWTRCGRGCGDRRQAHHGPLRLCEIELVRDELEVTRNRSARGAATRPFSSSGRGTSGRRRLTPRGGSAKG